jgi:ribosomal protein L5
METVKQKENTAYKNLATKYGYKNRMAAPHLVKVVVAVGTGSGIKRDKDRNKFVMERLSKITGQEIHRVI